ncbi:LysR family transcriptional regulator [Aliidiomarina shirensis]|uniref:LysR family transcriptional regulator n=1 Tax=Aliidiomarina shirensis TaxID=1048642 RepID=A0A432WWL3_9GAMM|nr:LysR family transcriptional regulator [Aliidiomarina shirensis]RUO38141.1 LysR family transcriptional regulator [Aliidiomarina shirensis]
MQLRQLNFRLLEVFQQVVEEKSISAAARKLHLTQPTISAQIRRLEDVCAAELLQQEGRQMIPTLAGEHLYRACGDIMRRMHECTQAISAIREGDRGTLKISLVNTAQYVIPPLVAKFNRQYPDIGVELSIGNRSSTLQRYNNNADDIYIFSHPPSDSMVKAEPFMANRLQLIAPVNHWAVQQCEPVSFQQLVDEPFLMREPGSATRMVFDTWLAGRGLYLNHTTQIESNEAIRISVAAGMGLAVLSEHIIDHGSDAVARVNTEGFPLPGQWYMVSRNDSSNANIIDKFRVLALTANL